ncbi:hypothetical protein LJC59_01405 [Desulfovibrio sp. OttesenSCG-928-A18]|nr:hypothetical protein [Desulfovibrio sp. OttesenSCG-928-A18]
MQAQTFLLCILAVCALFWGVFGLRFAASVLFANLVLGFIRYLLNPCLLSFFNQELSSNAIALLSYAYPLYWGLAFALCRGLDNTAPLNVPLRLILGFVLALSFVALASWTDLRESWRLFHATYIIELEKRPEALRRFFAESSQKQRCEKSHATLLRMALKAGDKEEMRIVLEAEAQCPRASATMRELGKELVDRGDIAGIEQLLGCGLKASTLTYSVGEIDGSLLAYAAITTDNSELVRSIIRNNPEEAAKTPDLERLFLLLEMRNRDDMLELLQKEGLSVF